jgi:hypothetical protein
VVTADLRSNREQSATMQSNNRTALIFGISGQDGAYLADLLQRKLIALSRATITYSEARKPVFHALTPFCRMAFCAAEPG